MTEHPLNFGPVTESTTTRYFVRYTTTGGMVHEVSYKKLESALADTYYPINESKELFEVVTVYRRRKALSPIWTGQAAREALIGEKKAARA